MTVSKIRLPDNTEHDIRAKYLIQSTSADAVSAEFSARAVTDDAIANIQKIYGNTVKWNQLNKANSATSESGGITFTNNGNGSFTCSGTCTTLVTKSTTLSSSFPQIISGHIYVLRGCPSGGSISSGYVLRNPAGTIYDQGGGLRFTSSSTSSLEIDMAFRAGTYSNITFWPQLIDLTAIYGSGNEPTLSEFKAQYPADYYPYSPLTLLSNSATSIQSKDSGNNVIGNCDLNIPTLTGKLNGAGSSVLIFPDGMKKAGTVYDEVVGNKAIKRVYAASVSEVTVALVSTGLFQLTINSSGTRPGRSYGNGNFNIISNKYPTYTAEHSKNSTIAQLAAAHDKTLFVNAGSTVCYIQDSAYTSTTGFLNSGVEIFYEMDTSQEYTLDNALQFQYPVVAGGTEMVLPTSGTVPMKMDVIYGNAADAAATMSQNFISVDSMKEFLDKLGTQMGGTWSMGYENGKHTFTFTSN